MEEPGKLHIRGLEATHVLLYAILLALSVSGVAMLALSDLPQVLSGAAPQTRRRRAGKEKPRRSGVLPCSFR